MNRIDAVFQELRAAGRFGLFPYLTAGYPTLDATERLALAAVEGGADGLELGVPFSDPVADGVTLQHASEVALGNGSSLRWTLELVHRLRSRLDAMRPRRTIANENAARHPRPQATGGKGPKAPGGGRAGIPLILMTYYNPIHRWGIRSFVQEATRSGLDGVIVTDLPSGEAAPLLTAAQEAGAHLIQMVAPTSSPERLAEVGRVAEGFVYCVSLLATTGARAHLSEQLPDFLQRVRAHISQPLLVGFGIARPEHILGLRPYADACVVGSAIADLLQSTPPPRRQKALGSYIAELRRACEAPPP